MRYSLRKYYKILDYLNVAHAVGMVTVFASMISAAVFTPMLILDLTEDNIVLEVYGPIFGAIIAGTLVCLISSGLAHLVDYLIDNDKPNTK